MIFQKVKELHVKAWLPKFGPKLTYKGNKRQSTIKLSSDTHTCIMHTHSSAHTQIVNINSKKQFNIKISLIMVIIENTRDKEEKFIISTQGARSVK